MTKKTYNAIPNDSQFVYDSSQAVKRYSSNNGIWPVEKYIINKYLNKKGGSVLDIACAAGRLALPLSKIGKYCVVGFDISYNQVKTAHNNTSHSNAVSYYFQGDMSSVGLNSMFKFL